jgi:hypothetical protein
MKRRPRQGRIALLSGAQGFAVRDFARDRDQRAPGWLARSLARPGSAEGTSTEESA